MSFSLNLKKLMLKSIRMNLLAFYSKCHNLIGDPPLLSIPRWILCKKTNLKVCSCKQIKTKA